MNHLEFHRSPEPLPEIGPDASNSPLNSDRSLGRILVIRGGAIGDFILTLPVLAALRRQFPRTHLEVLGYPHIVQLALAGGLADGVMSIEARALAGFFAVKGILDETLADYFASFHLMISYLYDPDGVFRINVARASGAEFISGAHRPDEKGALHATEVFLRPLERLAIFGADSVPRLGLEMSSHKPAGWPPALGFQTGSECPQSPRLALHPGSGGERKNWPEHNWAELMRWLADHTEASVLLVGGEAEGDRVRRLAALLPADRVEVAQNRPLVELATRLRRCRTFVGHDSGISHLAAALGLEGLILWGTTNQSVWAPRSPRMKILRHEGGLDALTVRQVRQELALLLNRHSAHLRS
ncbi:MAG: glycosyltransferase family 9 protein [Verrucomicrobia bacterium]|nr:glycosyltransferase family 9 protein [Verrucomicrobiota bacterium]